MMRVALLTNSRLSVPAIDFMGGRKWLAGVGLPEREDKTEDADHIQHMAAHHGVPVKMFARANLTASLTNWIAECGADVVLVFTFPFKIPLEVLSLPGKGFINFHFGLLPQYRGADAIFWQIRNREKEGGISVHQMTGQFDKGPLFILHRLPLSPADTYGSHLLNLSMAAVPVVERLMQQLQSGAAVTTPQDESLARYYSRPVLADLVIDWNKPAADIIALINAANPWNKGAIAFLNGYPLKVIAASQLVNKKNMSPGVKPGTITGVDNQTGCYVCCGLGEMLNLDILYCNDSFITGAQFARLGIQPGLQFENVPGNKVA